MPPHHLGGLYVATLTFTAIVQHYAPLLWLPLAALEVLAFLVLFVAAAFLRRDEDVLLAAFLVSFSVGIALIVSDAILGMVVYRSIGAVALSAPTFAARLFIRGLIFVPLMALLIWVARRVQRKFRPPPPRRSASRARS
jgi:membrane protein implicated in regulation of membrane protease activity